MRPALCKRPTWTQSLKCCRHSLYSAKYSRCSQLRPGLIVSSKLVKQLDQVCKKTRVAACRNVRRQHSYIRAYTAQGTAVPVHDMKAYGGTAPLILNFCTRSICVVKFKVQLLFFPGGQHTGAHSKRGGEGAGPNSLRVLKNSLATSKKFNDFCKLFT
jgi:hypothetical protein